MDPAFTLIAVFAIFIPALVLPGPDFIAVVRSAMGHGQRAGLLTTLGVSIGLAFYATLSLAGLAVILVEYQWLTWLVRVLGGAYLIYLGLVLLFSKPATANIEDLGQANHGNPLLFGFLVTLTNPKAIVLFASVFATAVSEATPLWLMLVMIIGVFLSALVWYASVSLFMSSRVVVGRFQRLRHWVERAAGICFVGLGTKIVTDARNPITP